jgi:putative phosphoribosyl transferase
MARPALAHATTAEVAIAADGRSLGGALCVPAHATGAVLFAHGSGSSRHSPRNRFVAGELQRAGIATLLMDLLDEREADDRDKVFDIELLAARLLAAARWLEAEPRARGLALGYFGASTGAAAALIAAAREPERVAAVVSRGGRPDLAAPWLPSVVAPTMLIVGERDVPVRDWNEQAFRRLTGEKELVVVPRATHLFEEAGTLELAAQHATRWFTRYLRPPG